MPSRPLLRQNACIVAVVVVLAGLRMGSVLFVPPVVGLANNADFERVMARVGLGYTTDRYEERYWSWSLTKYSIADRSPFQTTHVTTEVPLAWAAVQATRLLSREPIFDIRVLGAIHATLLLGALALLLRACRDLEPWVQWLAAGLAVFFLTDVGYTAAFNSLYGQTSSLLALLWIAGVAALAIQSGRMSLVGLAAYFAAAAWFVGSKPQECLQVPFLAFFGWRLWTAPAAARRPRFAVLPAVVLSLGLVGFAAWIYHRIPPLEIRDVGIYHTVFMDLLPNSPNAREDLEALGLDPGLVRYANRHAYMEGSPLANPSFRAAFFEKMGYAKLVGFYLARPSRLFERLERAGRLAFQLRPSNLGNLPQDSGAPSLYQYQHASTWSRWRLALGRFGIFEIALLLAGSSLAAARGWKTASASGRLFREGIVVLAAMGGLEFLVCSLADYLGDLPRHLYLFQAIFDLLLIIGLGWGAETLLVRGRSASKRPEAERFRAAEA